MLLIAVGKLRAGPERELFDRYNARLRPKLAVTEVGEARGAPAEIKRRETDALLEALPQRGFVIALDLGGEQLGSDQLAANLQLWAATARAMAFVIGGAEGLGSAVLARADTALSFGPMTWPHMLARVMLAEQLYRAQSIRLGHPYHRAGRP